MVFRSVGVVELGDDPNLSPIERDIVPIEIPNEVPPDGVVLIDGIGVGSITESSDYSTQIEGIGDYDYDTYEPFPGTITFSYTGDDVIRITTVNSFGTKIVDFTYTSGDVSQIDINNYGMASRTITFVKTGDIINQINIIEN